MTTTGAPADLLRQRVEDVVEQLSGHDQRVRDALEGYSGLPSGEVYLEGARDAYTVALNLLRVGLAASDSPPGAVGLGLVPPGPNPADKEGNS